MNVVIDTNVLVSGLFFTGAPSRILKAWQSQQFVLFGSTEILNEYARVIRELSHKLKKSNIVTGDKALLRTSGYKNLVVVTPALFERQYLI